MIQGIYLGTITIDCTDPVQLRDFYYGLLGGDCCVLYDCPALIHPSGFRLLFMPADFDYDPPVWPEQPGRQQKQIHFDFGVDDLPAAVSQAQALGARKAERQFGGGHFVTMFDPEGHPFCLCANSANSGSEPII